MVYVNKSIGYDYKMYIDVKWFESFMYEHKIIPTIPIFFLKVGINTQGSHYFNDGEVFCYVTYLGHVMSWIW